MRSILLVAAAALLYGPFLANPLVFDDLPFFMNGSIEHYAAGEVTFGLRWLPMTTLGLTHVFAGAEPHWYRIGNLLLHAAVGMSLYVLIARLLHLSGAVARSSALSPEWLACCAALAFLLSPAAVYGVGYLIQRTIVMATLFTLLMWLSLLHGLEGKGRGWLWVSVGFYFLAVFSKEHAVMAPAVALALAVLHARTSGTRLLDEATRLWPIFLLYALIAAVVVLAQRGLLGVAYEPQAESLLEGLDDTTALENPYLFSVITQCWLFFKYLLLWLVPNPQWMSVDMREPFATAHSIWPQILGVAGYLLYLLAAVTLLWRGGAFGLVGLALLAPALLFVTEFSAVRIQELFVLYRSYLWMPLLFALPPLLLARLERRWAGALMIVVTAALFAASLDRLSTFRHPILLWDDAVRLIEGREPLPGTARTIYIRGYYYNKFGFRQEALQDFDRALSLKPDYPAALKERGRARLALGQTKEALEDFNRAIAIRPDYALAYMGRAETFERMGAHDSAHRDFLQACRLNWKPACERLTAQ